MRWKRGEEDEEVRLKRRGSRDGKGVRQDRIKGRRKCRTQSEKDFDDIDKENFLM